jgi:hypothetical protein
MTRKLTLFIVCAFEIALILFLVAWTAWAGQQTEDGVVFYDGVDAEVIIADVTNNDRYMPRPKLFEF